MRNIILSILIGLFVSFAYYGAIYDKKSSVNWVVLQEEAKSGKNCRLAILVSSAKSEGSFTIYLRNKGNKIFIASSSFDSTNSKDFIYPIGNVLKNAEQLSHFTDLVFVSPDGVVLESYNVD